MPIKITAAAILVVFAGSCTPHLTRGFSEPLENRWVLVSFLVPMKDFRYGPREGIAGDVVGFSGEECPDGWKQFTAFDGTPLFFPHRMPMDEQGTLVTEYPRFTFNQPRLLLACERAGQ